VDGDGGDTVLRGFRLGAGRLQNRTRNRVVREHSKIQPISDARLEILALLVSEVCRLELESHGEGDISDEICGIMTRSEL
jgi:hypothetical protein